MTHNTGIINSAMQRVLSTTELLENILIQGLPCIDLTQAAATNKLFRGVIHGSSSLRKVMFIDPEEATETVMYTDMYGTKHQSIVTKMHPICQGLLFGGSDFMLKNYMSRDPHHASSRASDLLFQPPCKGVAMIHHRLQEQRFPDPMEQTAILGDTVGDILELVEKLLEEERNIYWVTVEGVVDERDMAVNLARSGLSKDA